MRLIAYGAIALGTAIVGVEARLHQPEPPAPTKPDVLLYDAEYYKPRSVEWLLKHELEHSKK